MGGETLPNLLPIIESKMAGCLIDSGIDVSCSTITIGGLNKRLWAFNLDDLATPIDTSSGYNISSLDFEYGKGLFVVDSFKKSHDAGYDVVIDAAGRQSFNHTVIVKLYADSNLEDLAIERMIKASALGFIVETNGKEFFVYGADNGCVSSAGTKRHGIDNTSDTSHQLTFLAEGELYMPRRVLISDYATTLALLESYEV